jgi:predicted nucleic acid-binding protein
MAFAVDSSIALAWLLPDERAQDVDALADRLERDAAIAPSLWPLEVGNALVTARRRDRLTDRDVERLLGSLRELPVEIEAPPPEPWLANLVALARKHGLTVYDSAYLELAQRRRVPLATLDARLAAACNATGVTVLP